MKFSLTLGGLAVATTAVLIGQMNTDAVAARGSSFAGCAPDVIVGDVQEIIRHGEVGDITAYSIGTNSCNIGCDYLAWEANNNSHPTIGGSAYRVLTLENGCTRIEQIGRSWLKHGFCALQQTLCGSCSNSGGNGCPDRLGWVCSDPYTASLNGQQSGLGRRSEVNPSTGFFVFPPAGGSYDNTTGRRMQIKTELLQAENAEFFVDGVYIHPDDAAACNGNNNASYRRVNKTGTNTLSFQNSFPTVPEKPAIFAWEASDPNVRITTIDISDCNERIHFGYSVCDNGDGTWTYIYTVYNMNLHHGIGGISIPFNGSSVPSDTDMHMLPYHSGEYYNENPTSDWTINADGSHLNFEVESYSQNPDANAILWQSLKTIQFSTTSPPTQGFVDLHFHKITGFESTVAMVPGDPMDPPTDCELADVNLDGTVDGTDLSLVLGFWGSCAQGCDADINEDGTVDGIDLSFILGWWGCDSSG